MSMTSIWTKITDERKRDDWLARVEALVGALPDYPWEQSYNEGMTPNEAVDEYLCEDHYNGYQQKTIEQIEAENEVLRQQVEELRCRGA